MIRYGALGLATNVAGYMLFLLATHFGAEPKLAMSVLYLIGASASFAGNRIWTFSDDGPLLPAAAKVIATHLVGWAFNYAILYIWADRLGYPYALIQAVAIVLVAGFVFLCFRFLIFNGRSMSQYHAP